LGVPELEAADPKRRRCKEVITPLAEGNGVDTDATPNIVFRCGQLSNVLRILAEGYHRFYGIGTILHVKYVDVRVTGKSEFLLVFTVC